MTYQFLVTGFQPATIVFAHFAIAIMTRDGRRRRLHIGAAYRAIHYLHRMLIFLKAPASRHGPSLFLLIIG